MPEDLDDVIRRTRRVVKAQSSQQAEPASPPGFADRVVRARESSSTEQAILILWQRLSFVGVAVACAVTILSATLFRGDTDLLAADPWLDMPMSSVGDESDQGETKGR